VTRSRHTVPTTTLSVSSARLRVIRALRRALIRLARPTLDSAAHSPPAPSCPTTARTTSCSPRARPPATPVAPRMGKDSPLVRVAAAQARPHLPHRPHAQVIWRVASPRLALCDVLRARPDHEPSSGRKRATLTLATWTASRACRQVTRRVWLGLDTLLRCAPMTCHARYRTLRGSGW